MNTQMLNAMKHSPVRNYVVPGLTRWLIGTPSEHGTVRLFECSREHQESITPHSHRFDFQCLVLRGEVRNRTWIRTQGEKGDLFRLSQLTYSGAIGEYVREERWVHKYTYDDETFCEGEWYSMKADEIHSINFSRDTAVLFFEGPPKHQSSVILEPWADGATVPTFEVRPWMFQREGAKA